MSQDSYLMIYWTSWILHDDYSGSYQGGKLMVEIIRIDEEKFRVFTGLLTIRAVIS